MKVLVPYIASEEGTRLIRFAGDLSRRLGATLNLILPEVSNQSSWDLVVEESTRVRTLVKELGFLCDVIVRNIELIKNEPGSIFVLNTFPKRMDLTILTPFWEQALQDEKEHCVLIPFGGRDAGRFAVASVMPIIAALGFRVVFYHTTWREGIASQNAEDHMAEEARLTRTMVEGIARDAHVPFETVIETAEDVVEGIILGALAHKASLIVATHGLNVIAGSYAKQLRIGPVPLLTIGRKEVLS